MKSVALMVAGLVLAHLAAAAERVTLVAGGGTGGDGAAAAEAKLVTPFGVAFDAQGRLLIVEFASRVRAIDAGGKIVSVVGNGVKGDAGDGGPATAAQVNGPHAIAVGGDGEIYIADSLNHKVRRIDAKAGVISTFAGTTKGWSGDGGPADKAQFNGIYCIALNPAKDRMVVTDLENRRVRVIDMKSGVVSAVAGNGERGVPRDGAEAVRAPLVDPRAAAMDSKGNVYVLERGGHALRVAGVDGKIRTVVPAKMLRGPKHLCVDREDNVIVADTDNHRVVKWLAAEGRLVAVAGTGVKGTAGVGGPADEAQLNQPHGVYLDARGSLYISDSMNGRVLRVGD